MYLVKSHRTRIDGTFTRLAPGQQYEPTDWELRAYPDRFSEEPLERSTIDTKTADDYTHRELVALAQAHQIPGYSGKTKLELFDLVQDVL